MSFGVRRAEVRGPCGMGKKRRANDSFALETACPEPLEGLKLYVARRSESHDAFRRKLRGRPGRAPGAEPPDLEFHVLDREAVLFLQGLPEALDVGAAELDDFRAGHAYQVVVLLVAGGLEVAVVLLQVGRFHQTLLAQEIEGAVDGGEAHAVAALARNLKDLVRPQVPRLLADDLQDSLALPGEAAAG